VNSTGDRARGAGIHNEDVNNITIANCTFRNNYARYDGGGIYNYQSELAVTNCIFSNNTTGDDGSGIYNSNTDAALISCTFASNQAENRGGAIYNYQSGSQLINCLFSANHADSNGGAIYNGYKAVEMINCTIAGNSAAGGIGGIYNSYSSSTITNCIVWDSGQAVYNHSSNFHISYCNIEGCGGSGAGWDTDYGIDEGNNLDVLPCFADINNPEGTDGIFATSDDGLVLQAESPCIDAGNNSALPAWITMDIKGDARFNGTTDLGAYEFGNLAMNQDSDNDGMPDWWEYKYQLDPNDPEDGEDDMDEDGLTNLGEYENNCDIMYFDSDGDLLADGWEVGYGLDPLDSDVVDVVDGNNVYADTDSDGLDTLKEAIFSTAPTIADSDGDGTSDGAEVAQGGLPADASDGGLPPSAEQICELRLTVGDWSSSNSERYDLVVGPVRHQASQFGAVTTANYNQFRPGNRYEVRIVHRGTIYYMQDADYDYVANIEAVSIPPGVIFEIDDPDGILGTHGEPNTMNYTFDAAGKTAYVNLIKADITYADVTEDKIHVNLEPSGLTGTLKLELTGLGVSHVIREVVRTSGSYDETFDIPNLTVGEYTKAKATWTVDGQASIDEHDYHIQVLGEYKHTCYNTPDESGCSGSPQWFSYTIGDCINTDCVWHEAQGKNTWLSEITENGSGKDANGYVYSMEWYCTGNPHSPKLRRTGCACAQCGGCLSAGDVAINSAHEELACGDEVFVYQHGKHTVNDHGGGLTTTQLDHYYGVSGCNECPSIGDSVMTIKLYE